MNIKKIILSAALFGFATIAQAEQDAEKYEMGEEAHNGHCTKCHTDSVYIRENRFIKSKAALDKQVNRCKTNTDAAWFEEDVEAVSHFLNEKYYKF